MNSKLAEIIANLPEKPRDADWLLAFVQAEEAGYQRALNEVQTAPRVPLRHGGQTCTVCHVEWVDVEAGMDTCARCLQETGTPSLLRRQAG